MVDAAKLTAYGRRAARKAFTRDDDEMRKTITAIAIGAIPSVLFDNLDIQLSGAALDVSVLTAIDLNEKCRDYWPILCEYW